MKLLQEVKGTKFKDNQSNNWDLDVDLNYIQQIENNDLEEILEKVREKDELIKETEKVMQVKSIYDTSYKPQFIASLEEDDLKEFSNTLNQKMRQVKLAITKANMNQTKFIAFELEKKKRDELSKKLHYIINNKKDVSTEINNFLDNYLKQEKEQHKSQDNNNNDNNNEMSRTFNFNFTKNYLLKKNIFEDTFRKTDDIYKKGEKEINGGLKKLYESIKYRNPNSKINPPPFYYNTDNNYFKNSYKSNFKSTY